MSPVSLPDDCTFHQSRARMLLVEHDGKPFDVEHSSRVEECKKRDDFGVDLTKLGSEYDVPRSPVVRVIGKETKYTNAWTALLDVNPATILSLASKCDSLLKGTRYEEVWKRARELVRDGKASFRVCRPLGVKIVFATAPMDTPHRRKEFAKLMRTERGAPSYPNKSFNDKIEKRYIVTEQVDPKRPDMGYFTNEEGEVDTSGYLSAAVYNKPVEEAPLHWVQITKEEARSVLEKYQRAVPNDMIRILRSRIAEI